LHVAGCNFVEYAAQALTLSSVSLVSLPMTHPIISHHHHHHLSPPTQGATSNVVNEQTHLLPILVHNNNQKNNNEQCNRCISCITASITIIYVCYFLLLANNKRVIDIASKHIPTPTYDYNRKCIHPGCMFLDTHNNLINAHGGGFLYYKDTYYWYGEIKSGPTYLPSSNAEWGGTRVDLTGISCYSSHDLVSWKYHGNVLPAVTNDSSHDLYIDKVAERPKVVYNEESDKFVMWLHIDSMDYSRARCGVATSDRPEGPFQYIHSFRPNGQDGKRSHSIC
jgi:hypothetical protein